MDSLACTCFVVALLLFATGLVPAITAAHFHSVTLLTNRATGRVHDSEWDGTVFTRPDNGCVHQQWYIHGEGDTFDLTNAATGRILDSNWDGTVYTLPYNGCAHQKWRMHGEYLQNVATGRYLDSNHNGDVNTLQHNGGMHQQWAAHHEVKF